MEKTSVMRFSRSRKLDFLPQVKFHVGTVIQTKTETKLVGVIVSQNLSWQKNTDYICEKARKKLWTLRRLAEMDIDIHTM